MRTNRGNVDHGPLRPLLFDLCSKGVTAEEDTFDVDVHDLVKLFLSNKIGALDDTTSVAVSQFFGATYLVRVACPRIIHQNVKMPPKLYGLFHRTLPVCRFGDIHNLKRKGFRLFCDLVPGFFIDIANEDLCTFFDEVLCDALAKARRGAFSLCQPM